MTTTRIKRKLERIEKVLDKISSSSEKGIPIIVEGRKDERSLRRLHIRGEIMCIQSTRENLTDSLNSLRNYNEVLVLTDFDGKGEELARFIEQELSSMRIKSNFKIWKELKGLTSHDLNEIEGLAKYIDNLRLKMRKEDR